MEREVPIDSKVVAVSGYFLVFHAGHEEYFRKSKELGNKLIVILNNDIQQKLKYGKVIIPYEQRLAVISSIKYVNEVFKSKDRDLTVCNSLSYVRPDIFAKGGDRTKDEIPELKICNLYRIKIVDGLGKKIQSSSKLLCQKFLS